MQKIVPNLWFDKEAREAAKFYVSIFGRESKVKSVETLHDTPSGDIDVVPFTLWGYDFMSISAGPLFRGLGYKCRISNLGWAWYSRYP